MSEWWEEETSHDVNGEVLLRHTAATQESLSSCKDSLMSKQHHLLSTGSQFLGRLKNGQREERGGLVCGFQIRVRTPIIFLKES